MELTGTADAVGAVSPAGHRSLSPTLAAFLQDWQPRQRRTAGYQAMLFTRLDTLSRAHPEWADYDLMTHLLGALHLIIENDRLTGGHTREQIVDELAGLVALEHREDMSARHQEIAAAVVDVLLNTRGRQTRLSQPYMRANLDGTVDHPPLTLRLVQAVGDDDAVSPVLRPTPEAINIFQNLYDFDPSDRAAAERYRSERMLRRRDYDEVLSSVERRSTSIHGLQSDLDRMLRRIAYNVRDVDYASDVIPRLDEAMSLIGEQVDAEEKFASTVAEHVHDDAPDLPRLHRIIERLQQLIRSLSGLHRTTASFKRQYEEQQDRQLFTYRRMTISPQAEIVEPLLGATPEQLIALMEEPLATWMGVREPRIPSLRALFDRVAPPRHDRGGDPPRDPFDLGDVRNEAEEFDPALAEAASRILDSITEPLALSELLSGVATGTEPLDDLEPRHRLLLPWVLGVAVAGGYGSTDAGEAGNPATTQRQLTVLRTGQTFDDGTISGDDLLIVPRAREITVMTGGTRGRH
jgi:hypothetical protein